MAFLNCDELSAYCRRFNETDRELYSGDIPNKDAEAFLTAGIPRFECPNPVIQEIWYFRWWSFRKHIRSIRQSPPGIYAQCLLGGSLQCDQLSCGSSVA